MESSLISFTFYFDTIMFSFSFCESEKFLPVHFNLCVKVADFGFVWEFEFNEGLGISVGIDFSGWLSLTSAYVDKET